MLAGTTRRAASRSDREPLWTRMNQTLFPGLGSATETATRLVGMVYSLLSRGYRVASRERLVRDD